MQSLPDCLVADILLLTGPAEAAAFYATSRAAASPVKILRSLLRNRPWCPSLQEIQTICPGVHELSAEGENISIKVCKRGKWVTYALQKPSVLDVCPVITTFSVSAGPPWTDKSRFFDPQARVLRQVPVLANNLNPLLAEVSSSFDVLMQDSWQKRVICGKLYTQVIAKKGKTVFFAKFKVSEGKFTPMLRRLNTI